MQHAPRFLKIVDDAKSRIKEISIDEVKQKLDRGEEFSSTTGRWVHSWRHCETWTGKGVR